MNGACRICQPIKGAKYVVLRFGITCQETVLSSSLVKAFECQPAAPFPSQLPLTVGVPRRMRIVSKNELGGPRPYAPRVSTGGLHTTRFILSPSVFYPDRPLLKAQPPVGGTPQRSGAKGGPKVNDPTTWPQHWKAADIKTFLDGKLKPGASINYDILALGLQHRDFKSLNKHYHDELAPATYLTAPELLDDMSKKMFKDGFKLITSSENWNMILHRSGSIESDTYVVRTDAPVAVEGVVCMVTCESGGGKTVDATAAAYRRDGNGVFSVVFYCLATDIKDGITDNLGAVDRNSKFIANLTAAMESVFANKGHSGFLTTLSKTKERIALGIVVDEAGGSSSVVRALCGVVKGLGGSLGLPANVTVRVAVAGTGIGCGSVPPGSLPDTYTLHHVSTGERVEGPDTKEKSPCGAHRATRPGAPGHQEPPLRPPSVCRDLPGNGCFE